MFTCRPHVDRRSFLFPVQVLLFRSPCLDIEQGQLALLKMESCCDVTEQLFSTAKAGQDNVSAVSTEDLL